MTSKKKNHRFFHIKFIKKFEEKIIAVALSRIKIDFFSHFLFFNVTRLKTANQTNMEHSNLFNPSFFPLDINDLIFQHMTSTEILMFSEVSTDFYEFIADSSTCMKRIKLKLVKNEFSDDEKAFLSRRRYQNLEVAKFSQSMKVAEELIKCSISSFKTIRIKYFDFETFLDALKFFEVIEKSIVELCMDQVYIKSIIRQYNCKPQTLQFSRLKVLETRCCQGLLFDEVFANCTSLETFIVKSGSTISTSAFEALKKILKSNKGLKILGIHFNVFNSLFSENVSEFSLFKLSEFHANDLYRVSRSFSEVRKNLRRFIWSQISTLKVLSIGDWMGFEAFELFFNIPNLKKLTMKGFHHSERFIDWMNVEINQQPKIENLEFHDMSNNFNILKLVIKAVPNLKHLKLHSLDQNSLEFISQNAKALKSLHVEHFISEDI